MKDKNLLKVVEQYTSDKLTIENDWYGWQVNEDKLPHGIQLSEGNNYFKNSSLKKQLNEKWKTSSTFDEKNELIIYYISKWGGIRANGIETLREYTNSTAEQLIERGKEGIASWSKALVVRDSDNYAIFDARVSISLNCIQYFSEIENKTLFPILPTRNKTIAEGNKLIKDISKSEKWTKAKKTEFYNLYIDILKSVSKNTNTDISTIEMLLFAKAEELVKQLIKKLKTNKNYKQLN